jgi:hypothetical protein
VVSDFDLLRVSRLLFRGAPSERDSILLRPDLTAVESTAGLSPIRVPIREVSRKRVRLDGFMVVRPLVLEVLADEGL